MLSPNETMALRHLLEAGQANKYTLNQMMDISTDYADYMLRSLSQKGYLRKVQVDGRSKCGAYEVAPKGAEEILNVLNFIKNRQLYVAERAIRGAERVDRRLEECKQLMRQEFPGSLKPAGVA